MRRRSVELVDDAAEGAGGPVARCTARVTAIPPQQPRHKPQATQATAVPPTRQPMMKTGIELPLLDEGARAVTAPNAKVVQLGSQPPSVEIAETAPSSIHCDLLGHVARLEPDRLEPRRLRMHKWGTDKEN